MTDSNAEILRLGNAGPKDPHYPAQRYSDSSRDKKTGELVSVRVSSKEEDDALGPGWHDSPKKVKAKKAEK